MNLKVFLAGRVAIESERGVIEEDRFPGRQGRLLFAYLVAEQGRPVPRDELADALWGEAPPATANKALGVLASKLRGLLADQEIDGATALTSAFGSYRLNLPDGTWVDLIAAADALRDAEAALATDDLDRAKKLGMEAASLARASFLPGEEGAWVDGKRRELTDIHRRALSCLADASLRSGDEAEAASWAEETIALDPYRETGYRQLMAAHAAGGNRAEALRVYERCRQLLATELGAYPSPETETFYRELLEAPSPEPGAAAAPEAPPVAVADREPPRAGSTRPAGVPRSLWRRRRVVIGVLAGVSAAVVIPFLALGGGGGVDLGNASNSVGVLDEGSGAVKTAFKLPAAPTAVAAGLGYVWAASAESNAVFAIEPKTSTVYRIDVENAPSGIAVGDRYVWVTNSLARTVSQIDPDAQIELQTISVGNGPTGIDVGGGHVWVVNTLDHTVSKIRTRDAKRVATYRAGTDPGAIAFGEGAVWVTSKSDGTVVKLSARNGQLLQTIPVGQGPAAVAFGLGSVWVANSVDGTVTQINPTSEKVVHTEKVGANLSGIAIVGDEVWTTNERTGTVSRIKPGTPWRTSRVPVEGRPAGLAAGDARAYVALRPTGTTHRGGTLTVALDSLERLETLDLAVGSLNIVLWRFTALTNDGLLAYRTVGGQAGNEVVPDLARSMQISQDAKTYTFQLRPNIRYSNGRPVRATDFRYGIERGFRLRRRTDPSTDYLGPAAVFSGIRGANHCNLRRCNLAGIVANDGDRTIAFHLRAPDPYFVYKLASTFAVPVPAGTSLREATRRPLPSTGPYRIVSVTDKSVRLERNPYFQEWSATARPDGFPDEIVFKSVSTKKGIALVEQGKADLTSNFPLEPFSVAPTFRPQLKPHPLAGTVYLVLDPSRPPFNDLRARRAFNYALDRNKVAQLATKGSRPTCQVLPPNFPGYRPHCPYTLPSAKGAWRAPDPSKAAELVEASGTRGASVTLWVDRDFVVNVRVGRYLQRLLKRLGYRPQLRESFPGTPRTYFVALEQGVMSQHRGPQVAFAAWEPDYPAASSFIQELFACKSNFNYSRFCDPTLERTIKRAVQLEQTDRVSANRLWSQVDREITDRALWVPLFNGYQADLVSKRVGNYEYNPRYGALLSQLWVR